MVTMVRCDMGERWSTARDWCGDPGDGGGGAGDDDDGGGR